jgi:hypothetical protein
MGNYLQISMPGYTVPSDIVSIKPVCLFYYSGVWNRIDSCVYLEDTSSGLNELNVFMEIPIALNILEEYSL